MARRRRKGKKYWRKAPNWPANLKISTIQARIRNLEQELRRRPALQADADRASRANEEAKEQLGYQERRSAIWRSRSAATDAIYANRKNYELFRWPDKHRAVYHQDPGRLVAEAQAALARLRNDKDAEAKELEDEQDLLTRQLFGTGDSLESGQLPKPPRSVSAIEADIQMYRTALKKKAETTGLDLLERDRLRAAKAALEGRTRQEGASVRQRLRATTMCPYCGQPLGAADAHADHIYPVALGGQSRDDNMVLVCRSCNLRKRDKTLRQFLRELGVDPQDVEKRLESLGKVF